MDDKERKERKAEGVHSATNGTHPAVDEHLREAHLILQELYRIVGTAGVGTAPQGFVGWQIPQNSYFGY